MRRNGSRAVNWVVLAAVAALSSPVSMSFAAVLNDEVTSVKLKEADGTSGQNTNSGSGVKTGHIQNGAVTNAKIGGTISVDKIETYSGVKIVHTGLADGIHTFNSMNAAINSITTPDQPTYIKVMPGSYDGIDLSKAYLIIEGSGKENTFIDGAGGGSNTTPAIIRNMTLGNSWVCGIVSSNTTLENVNCNGALSSRPGVVLKLKDMLVMSGGISSEGPAEISNVTTEGVLNLYSSAVVKGSTINGSIISQGSSTTITDTVVNTASGQQYGIGIFGSNSARITNVQAYGAQYAVQVAGATVDITNSHLGGGDAGLAISYGTVHIANTNLSGTAYLYGNTEGVKLVNCFDSGFNPIPNK